MDPSLSLVDIKKTLECAICLDVLRNPRRLACEHSFCKDCLDNLLEFDTFGNCTIKCPKQCKKITSISKNETTNDLGIDYIVKGILGMVVTKDQSSTFHTKPTCQATPVCGKDIVHYCSSCNFFFCSSCSCNHDVNEYYQVSYNNRDKKVNVVCKKHLTEAKWMCCHHYFCQNDFICIYCCSRDHRGHVVKSIESQAEELRDKLIKEVHDVGELAKMLEKSLQQAESNILSAKHMLEETLQYRKFLCLDKYIQELDKEEERINNEFEKSVEKHRKQFIFKDSSEAYQEMVSKEDILIALQTKNIYNIITSSRPSIREEVVSLTDHHFNTAQPLGNISVKTGSRVGTDGTSKTFKCNLTNVGMDDVQVKLNMFNTLQGRIQHSFPAAYLAQEKQRECTMDNGREGKNENGKVRDNII